MKTLLKLLSIARTTNYFNKFVCLSVIVTTKLKQNEKSFQRNVIFLELQRLCTSTHAAQSFDTFYYYQLYRIAGINSITVSVTSLIRSECIERHNEKPQIEIPFTHTHTPHVASIAQFISMGFLPRRRMYDRKIDLLWRDVVGGLRYAVCTMCYAYTSAKLTFVEINRTTCDRFRDTTSINSIRGSFFSRFTMMWHLKYAPSKWNSSLSFTHSLIHWLSIYLECVDLVFADKLFVWNVMCSSFTYTHRHTHTIFDCK